MNGDVYLAADPPGAYLFLTVEGVVLPCAGTEPYSAKIEGGWNLENLLELSDGEPLSPPGSLWFARRDGDEVLFARVGDFDDGSGVPSPIRIARSVLIFFATAEEERELYVSTQTEGAILYVIGELVMLKASEEAKTPLVCSPDWVLSEIVALGDGWNITPPGSHWTVFRDDKTIVLEIVEEHRSSGIEWGLPSRVEVVRAALVELL